MATTVPSSAEAAAAPTGAIVLRDRGAVRRDSLVANVWDASGTSKIVGDVRVGDAQVSGLLTVGGRLTAGRLAVHGTLEVAGATEVVDRALVEGTFRPAGAVRLGAGNLRGVLRGPAPVTTERDLVVVGTLEVPSVDAGLLDLEGTARVPGDVRCRSRLSIRFKGDSELGTAAAPEVVLRGPPPGLVPSLMRKVLGGDAEVRIVRVEADRVELEAVRVGLVRSPSIVLGPGAHVRTVEGTIVRRHPTARVGPESRTPPPHGLSR